MNERRQSERHPVRSVTVNIKTQGIFSKELVQSATVIDVSDKGLGVLSDCEIPEGEIYRFGFYLKWLKKTCYVIGKVLYCKPRDENKFHLGIKVTEDKDLTLSFIRTAMEEKAHIESQEISTPQEPTSPDPSSAENSDSSSDK